MLRQKALIAALAAGVSLLAGQAMAQPMGGPDGHQGGPQAHGGPQGHSMGHRPARPPMRHEVRPPRPHGPGHYRWRAGRWAWQNGAWGWIGGAWYR